MLNVVSNTTPLISLMKISKLDILQSLYSKIYIPSAVYNEIEAGRHKIYYENLSNKNWIHIKNIRNTEALKFFLDLDSGEAEAIILAT